MTNEEYADFVTGAILFICVIVCAFALAVGCFNGCERDSKAQCWSKTQKQECWK